MEHKIQEKATEIIGHNKEKAVELLGQTKEQAIDLIETKTSLLKKIFLVMLAIAIVVIGIWFFYEYKKGVIRDVDSFKDFINSFGIFGPLLLTIFQCVKTVYAVIPSTLGCIAGPALFGPWTGIICNYIGICSGSFLAFALSRKFGITLVKQIFSEKQYQRGLKKMEEQLSGLSLGRNFSSNFARRLFVLLHWPYRNEVQEVRAHNPDFKTVYDYRLRPDFRKFVQLAI